MAALLAVRFCTYPPVHARSDGFGADEAGSAAWGLRGGVRGAWISLHITGPEEQCGIRQSELGGRRGGMRGKRGGDISWRRGEGT